MDEDEAIAYTAVLLNIITVLGLMARLRQERNRRRRRPRRFGIHPLNRLRNELGQYNNYFREVRQHPDRFFEHTRMSVEQFDYLLNLLEPRLRKNSRREPICPEMRLLLTLRFLAEGETAGALKCSYRIGRSTLHEIVFETTTAIWEELRHTYLEPPSNQDEYLQIAYDFYDKWQMPNCVGSIDGKHFRIRCPAHTGSDYYNYKGFFSIVLLAVVDANYNFSHVHTGSPGSANDGTIMRDSTFGQMFARGMFPFPDPAVLPKMEVDAEKFPFFFIGDEAFALSTSMMRPYSSQNLNVRKYQAFNVRLCRARRVVENAFGILVARWQIFRKELIATPEKATSIVQAALVLHNFIQKTTEYANANVINWQRQQIREFDDDEEPIDMGNLQELYLRCGRRVPSDAQIMQEKLANYFHGIGKEPFQDEAIARGRY